MHSRWNVGSMLCRSCVLVKLIVLIVVCGICVNCDTGITPGVTCAQDEYGPNCTFCKSSDTCIEGHFTCNNLTGEKICMSDWEGVFCTEPVNKGGHFVLCKENECRNGGTCSHGYCCCLPGYTGIRCEIEVIECEDDSCINGGHCKDEVGSFTCNCRPGFTGDRCQIRTGSTSHLTTMRDSQCSAPCANGGTCFEDEYFRYCVCPTGYTGRNCETQEFNALTANNCSNGLFGPGCDVPCVPKDNCEDGHFTCDPVSGRKVCLSGWRGDNCDTRALPQSLDVACQSISCKNDGQCFKGMCCCKNNFSGTYCQIESIGCLSSPCMNNGTCITTANNFQCACRQNFTGRLCGVDLSKPDNVTAHFSIVPSPSFTGHLSHLQSTQVLPTTSSTFQSASYQLLPSTMLLIQPTKTSSVTHGASSSKPLVPSSINNINNSNPSIHNINHTPTVSSNNKSVLLASTHLVSETSSLDSISTSLILSINPSVALQTQSLSQTSIVPPETVSSDIIGSEHKISSGTLQSSYESFGTHSVHFTSARSSLHNFVSSTDMLYHFSKTVTNKMSTSFGISISNVRLTTAVNPTGSSKFATLSSLTPSTVTNTGATTTPTKHQNQTQSSTSPTRQGPDVKPTTQENKNQEGNTTKSGALEWWIIFLIACGVLLLIIIIILIIIMCIHHRRRDSRSLQGFPHDDSRYDKEHFSAQPDLINPAFEIGGDSDDDSVKHDMYIVNGD